MSRRMNVSDISRTPPVWASQFLAPDKLIPAGGKLDAAAFHAQDAVLVTVTAAAAAGAVALTVTALAGPIPAGTILDFGTTKLAILSADADEGDTALAVRATPTAFVGGETAWYAGTEVLSIPSGTVVGRTFAERATNDPYGPADAADDEIFLVAFDVSNANDINDCELVKPGLVIRENFLPGWSALASGVQDLVRERYVTQLGV